MDPAGAPVWWSKIQSAGGETRRLRRRRSCVVWYSCGDPVAAGALFEKNMLPKPVPGPVAVFCSATAAATPARAAEIAIPPSVRMPLRTLPPSLAAALPSSAWVILRPSLTWFSGGGTGVLVCT